MKHYLKIVIICLIILVLLTFVSLAENEKNDTSSLSGSSATDIVDKESFEEVDTIIGELETLLDPDNNELEEAASKTLEKYSNHWLVKLLKRIIDAITRFINAILKLATEGAKVGVD